MSGRLARAGVLVALAISSIAVWPMPALAETILDDSGAKVDAAALAALHRFLYKITGDPDSVLLRDLQDATLVVEQQGKAPGICGRFNAKNLLGGYVGYRRFIFVIMPDGKPDAIIEKACPALTRE